MSIMTKVVKLQLIVDQYDKDGLAVDYTDVYKILWRLQKQTREIKNKTIQYCWEYNNFASDYIKHYGKPPKTKEILNYTLEGYVNDKFKNNNDLYSGNCSVTSRNACKEFKNIKNDIISGNKSIMSYKENQPLDLHKNSIILEAVDSKFFVRLRLLNKNAKTLNNFNDTSIKFKINVKDNSSRTILQRCISNMYMISGSKLIYDKKKKCWYLNLCYSFEIPKDNHLEEDKILGVDLGKHCPVCASVYGDMNRLIIEGGEIEKFRKSIEARRISLLKQGKSCGDGRIGHGIKTRNKPTYKIEDKIARFRDTVNHKYSRSVVEYAVKNNCGVIQMENLQGINNKKNIFLKNWTYFDLQTKIEYKAKEKGIKVKYIMPNYTSQRCSKCGFISSENRETQARFVCKKCDYEENADYNASQNIAIKDIDNIIKIEHNENAKVKIP